MSLDVSLKYNHPSLSPNQQEKNWTSLDKEGATHLQLALTNTLDDMGRSALRIYSGKDQKASSANAGPLSITLTITEGGTVWAGPHTLNYPNVPAAAVAVFKGFLDGNIATVPKNVRDSERKGGGDKGHK